MPDDRWQPNTEHHAGSALRMRKFHCEFGYRGFMSRGYHVSSCDEPQSFIA